MNKEQKMFLGIISDHLQGRETLIDESLAEELNWIQIMKYAKSHQIEGIVYHQLQDLFENNKEYIDISRQMKNAQMACIFYYTSNVHTLEEIQEAFQKSDIRFFPVKGLEVADCYPIPMYRTMGDLDIVVFHKDKSRASSVLRDIGFTLLKNDYGLQFRKHNTNLEVDDHLLHKETLENSIRRSFFDTCWKHIYTDSKGRYHLDRSFHYIYLLEHTKKHFRTRGIGFRQFIDLAVFVQKQFDLDWEWIKAQLIKIDLLRFAMMAHTYIYIWWGIESPFETETLDDGFFQETTEYIFSSGVFGFDNENQSLFVAEASMNSDNCSGVFFRFTNTLKNTFIPYEQMVKLPYCSFTIGKKWLLPYCWFYRIFYILIHRKEYLKKNIVSHGSQEIMDNHRKLMGKWGI